jgi:hypothetical protein
MHGHSARWCTFSSIAIALPIALITNYIYQAAGMISIVSQIHSLLVPEPWHDYLLYYSHRKAYWLGSRRSIPAGADFQHGILRYTLSYMRGNLTPSNRNTDILDIKFNLK